jgi:adenosylhomocysteine nucleosidase
MRSAHRPPTALVCFAVREEARFFRSAQWSDGQVGVLVTGMGRSNAVQALEQALASAKPELVLTCGFAGGLRAGLPVGTVVYSEDAEAGLGGVLTELGAVPVRFLCSTRVAVTALEKRQLRAESGADAVEMESQALRDLCRGQNIVSATVRVISDSVEEDLPVDFNALMNERCQMRYWRLAGAVLRAPGTIRGLLRLQRQTRQAGQELGRVLKELLRRKGIGAG